MKIEEAVEVLKTGDKEEFIHKVKEGETLEEISNFYNLSAEDFMLLNSTLSLGNKLEADQEVKVEQKGPYVDVIVEKEGMREETIEHDKKVVETDELYIGESEVKQEGSDGKKEIRYTKTIVNGEEKETKIIEETIIEDPVEEIILKGTKQKPSRGDGSFVWPAVGGIITSEMGQRWGRMHKGIDISGVSDRTIKAADNGVVSEVSYNDGEYGNRVVIDHNNGYETYYFHLASVSVEDGEVVKAGEKIGVMGSTGNSTGMHLHFEVHKNGSVKNPLNYVSN
nr:M23 family metallopeptidase [Thalassobacillus pellis]